MKKRAEIAKRYCRKLLNKKGICVFPGYRDSRAPAFYRYLVELKDYEKGEVIKRFRKLGIEASEVSIPLNILLGDKDGFPVSAYVYNNFISIPIYPSLSDREVKFIADSFDKIFL